MFRNLYFYTLFKSASSYASPASKYFDGPRLQTVSLLLKNGTIWMGLKCGIHVRFEAEYIGNWLTSGVGCGLRGELDLDIDDRSVFENHNDILTIS